MCCQYGADVSRIRSFAPVVLLLQCVVTYFHVSSLLAGIYLFMIAGEGQIYNFWKGVQLCVSSSGSWNPGAKLEVEFIAEIVTFSSKTWVCLFFTQKWKVQKHTEIWRNECFHHSDMIELQNRYRRCEQMKHLTTPVVLNCTVSTLGFKPHQSLNPVELTWHWQWLVIVSGSLPTTVTVRRPLWLFGQRYVEQFGAFDYCCMLYDNVKVSLLTAIWPVCLLHLNFLWIHLSTHCSWYY